MSFHNPKKCHIRQSRAVHCSGKRAQAIQQVCICRSGQSKNTTSQEHFLKNTTRLGCYMSFCCSGVMVSSSTLTWAGAERRQITASAMSCGASGLICLYTLLAISGSSLPYKRCANSVSTRPWLRLYSQITAMTKKDERTLTKKFSSQLIITVFYDDCCWDAGARNS